MGKHTGYQGCLIAKEENQARTITILCEYFGVGLIIPTHFN